MATFLIVYLLGILACFGILMFDESFSGKIQSPFLAIAIVASVLWPFFLLLAVFVIIQDWIECRGDRVFND